MVHVMKDVFRADCIAGFGVDDSGTLLQVFLIGNSHPLKYRYNSIESLKKNMDVAIKEWEHDLASQ